MLSSSLAWVWKPRVFWIMYSNHSRCLSDFALDTEQEGKLEDGGHWERSCQLTSCSLALFLWARYHDLVARCLACLERRLSKYSIWRLNTTGSEGNGRIRWRRCENERQRTKELTVRSCFSCLFVWNNSGSKSSRIILVFVVTVHVHKIGKTPLPLILQVKSSHWSRDLLK